MVRFLCDDIPRRIGDLMTKKKHRGVVVTAGTTITVLTFFKLSFPYRDSRSVELRTQKLKSHLMRTQSLNVLPLKPGEGQYIAIHATLTAGEFFLANFYPSGSFMWILSRTSP